MRSSDIPTFCRRCGAELKPGRSNFYQIHIEATCDPDPVIDTNAQSLSFEEALAEAAEFTEQELMDMVYRKIIFFLCGNCYTHWIEDPTG